MAEELPISSPYRSRPDEPVDDGERNRLSDRLNAAYEAGLVDADDYRTRLDRLFAAQRLGEPVPVVQGLPPMPTFDTPAIVAQGPGASDPGQLTSARAATGLTVVVGGVVLAAVLLVLVGLLVLLV